MNVTILKRAERINISKKLLLLALPVALIFGTMAACEGPQGPEGLQGPQGPEGPVGPAGEDGSVIHAGTDAPSADLGTNGDSYLDQNTGELYGPKNDDGWGTPINLQGPPGEDGADGEDGSQIHSGTGSPDASLGVIGDYYLDKENFDLYGPKTDSGWETPISLKGTANVIYSSWTEFETSNWSSLQTVYSDFREYPVQAPQIDDDIVNQGVVLVYISFACCSDVDPLPVVIDNNNKVRFDYLTGEIQIKRSNYPDATGDPGTFGSGNEFRYVIIPGGVAAKSKMSKKQLKEMSYQEVKKRFGIQDLPLD